MLVFGATLGLVIVGIEGISPPRATACQAVAAELSDENTVACQLPHEPSELAPTQPQFLAQPTPPATELAHLPNAPVFLPVVLAIKVQSQVPSPTPTPTVAAPTATDSGPPNPGTNQLANPCFDGTHNDDPLVWQQTAGWDVSMKPTNPCAASNTAARINDPAQAGESGPNRDERIWQSFRAMAQTSWPKCSACTTLLSTPT
jgi:hypothetical protein